MARPDLPHHALARARAAKRAHGEVRGDVVAGEAQASRETGVTRAGERGADPRLEDAPLLHGHEGVERLAAKRAAAFEQRIGGLVGLQDGAVRVGDDAGFGGEGEEVGVALPVGGELLELALQRAEPVVDVRCEIGHGERVPAPRFISRTAQ